jgi:hypothetical protein
MLRKFHALLRELNIMDQKEAILEGYGYESARDLPDHLLEDAIHRLVQHRDGANAGIRRLRSDILCILQDMGIYQNNNSWSRVNEYLLNPKIAGKLLYQMDDDELTALRVKLNSILSKQGKKVIQERKAAQNN